MIGRCSCSSRTCQPQSRLDKQEVLNLFSICLLSVHWGCKVSPSVSKVLMEVYFNNPADYWYHTNTPAPNWSEGEKSSSNLGGAFKMWSSQVLLIDIMFCIASSISLKYPTTFFIIESIYFFFFTVITCLSPRDLFEVLRPNYRKHSFSVTFVIFLY